MKNKVVIYIHGMHGSSKEADDFICLKDYDVVGLDYVDGDPWDVGKDVRNKFQNIIKDYQEVVVVANSIGALYSYECLADFNIKQAFFISPVASMFQVINSMMKAANIPVEELKEKKFIKLSNGVVLSYDSYLYFANYHDNWKVPTEILYGTKDQLVKLDSVKEFISKHPGTGLTIKEGAGHHFHTEEEKAFVKNWIINNIK